MTDDYTIYNRTERIPKRDLVYPNEMRAAWATFMVNGEAQSQYWDQLYEYFPAYLFYVCEGETVVAQGKCIPLRVDDDDLTQLSPRGWDWALETGVQQYEQGMEPNYLCALEMAVSPPQRGKGISRYGLRYMREIARRENLQGLIAPVRPSEKHRYPLMSMQEYIELEDADGYSIDAWVRTHQRMGARILRVCEQSMRITGTIAEWQSWTGMRFPGTGMHIVPQALHPVHMDVENDIGTYIEANVWMLHPLD